MGKVYKKHLNLYIKLKKLILKIAVLQALRRGRTESSNPLSSLREVCGRTGEGQEGGTSKKEEQLCLSGVSAQGMERETRSQGGWMFVDGDSTFILLKWDGCGANVTLTV